MFAREVDYCSGACLLVRRELFEQLGGFDPRYAPAYYEDTDLCFGLRALGYKVIYQPLCEVLHHEGGCENGAKRFQSINRRKFVAKWQGALIRQARPGTTEPELDRRSGPRILVIDHQIPRFDQDSGALRAFMVARLLSTRMDCRVTYMYRGAGTLDRYSRALGGIGVRILEEDEALADLSSGKVDLVVVAREKTAREYIARVHRAAPKVPVVFDTVDVHFVRELRAATLKGDGAAMQAALATKASELDICRQCDLVIAVTEADKSQLLEADPSLSVAVIPNIHETQSMEVSAKDRCSLLFVGGFDHDPNVDAMLYFVRHIWPQIREELGSVNLAIVGSRPPPSIVALEGDGICVSGYVPNLEPYYQRARVCVAPLRYGAGMKGKIGQALSFGVPVVTTDIGAEGMGLVHGTTCLIAPVKPANLFARAVAQLFSDDALWHRLATNGKAHLTAHYSPEAVAPAVAVLREMALPNNKARGRAWVSQPQTREQLSGAAELTSPS
jgi:glycosyltransferase involved in cell wall biosynthesis